MMIVSPESGKSIQPPKKSHVT